MIYIRNNTTRLVINIHVWYIAHIDNLIISDCLKAVREYVNQI